MALSDEHIKKHLVEWTDDYLNKNDGRGGGHSGFSLNALAGLLGERGERVGRLAFSIMHEGMAPDYDAQPDPDRYGYYPLKKTRYPYFNPNY